MKINLLITLELIYFIAVNCSGIAKLNLQKIVPIQSGYYNKISFHSDKFWDNDSSHTMTQDGEMILQLLYPYDSSMFDIFIFNSKNIETYQKYEENVKSIKQQRSCVEAKPLDIEPDKIKLKQNKAVFKLPEINDQIVVIDNTKYPCNNGSYYPLIQLHYEYSVTLNFEYSYYYAYKSVILIGVLLVLIYVSGIIIFYFRQRKQRKKLLKRQLEENQLFQEKDNQQGFTSNANDNIIGSEIQSDKANANSLESFSAGFQRSYNQKSFFQNSLQMSQNLTSRAGNTNSGKSMNQQSQFASMEDNYNSMYNKIQRNMDSKRDFGNNRSIYDERRSLDNSLNGFNESSFNSEQKYSFADKISPKQFNPNNQQKPNSSFIKNNPPNNYYQNDEKLDKIQEEDVIPNSPYTQNFQFD